MTDAGAPENPAPEETSTPEDARTTDDLETKPAGATGDDIPDAAPATSPEGMAADEAVPAEAGAGAPTQARPEGEIPKEGVGAQAAAPADGTPAADDAVPAAAADAPSGDAAAEPASDATAEPAAADAEPPADAGDAEPSAAEATADPASDAEPPAGAGEAEPTAVEVTAEPEPEPEAPREPDEVRDPIVEQIRAALGDDVLGSEVLKGDMTIRVTNASWRRAAEWSKAKGFTYFCFLSGIDWLPSVDAVSRYENVYAAAEDAPAGEMTTGYGGGDTRFQVLLRLYDVDRKVGITLKADLDDTNPSVESIANVFRGADWHEREAWEMFGFDFPGHPGLRHLYLPGEFEGFPLRKDFPLLARAVKPWPGLVDKEPIPGEDEEEEAAAPA